MESSLVERSKCVPRSAYPRFAGVAGLKTGHSMRILLRRADVTRGGVLSHKVYLEVIMRGDCWA